MGQVNYSNLLVELIEIPRQVVVYEQGKHWRFMFKTTKPPRPITSFPLHQRSCHISQNNRILRKGKAAVRAEPHHLYPTIRDSRCPPPVGADVLGRPQPPHNAISFDCGCGPPRTSAPTDSLTFHSYATINRGDRTSASAEGSCVNYKDEWGQAP